MVEEASEIFKVLGVDTRIKIIELLKSSGPMGAKKISELLGITTAAVSQHLKVLKHARLVRSERKGYWIPYAIDEDTLENCRVSLNKICKCGCKDTAGPGEEEPEEGNLESLREYERELARELKLVRQRIEKMEGRKR